MKLRSLALWLALVVGLGAAPGVLRADDKPAPSPSPSPSTPAKTPEQIKQEQKDKDFKKAKDDLEKDLTAKKQDPQPPCALLQYLSYAPIDLEVKDALAIVKKVLAKKIPIATDVMGALGQQQQKAYDQKTQKLDVKKMMTEFKKWVEAWKPPAPTPSPSPGK